MSDPYPNVPKIFVDVDWKSQVHAEKESLRHPTSGGQQEPPSEEHPPIPEASFSVLVTTLASQSMVALGQFPAPEEQEVPVHLEFAKHCIDMLGVLEQKTAGNLTPDESQLLGRFLYELRMLYVAVQKELQKQATQPTIVTPES